MAFSSMVVVSLCYQNGVSLDWEYYLNRHLPLAEELLVPVGLRRAEVRRGLGTPTGDVAPYQAIAHLYFDSVEAFQAASQTQPFAAAVADVTNFYKGMPEIFIEQVAGEF